MKMIRIVILAELGYAVSMQIPPTLHPPLAASCRHTRLAESSVAAIDQCSCGMLQLHLGAFTVRLAPCAGLELLATLKEAMAKHAPDPVEPVFSSCASTPRGQA
jgi:hypothetical protein